MTGSKSTTDFQVDQVKILDTIADDIMAATNA